LLNFLSHQVFDGARARERERELLYPDACGGGGRGWISQGIVSYGRGHGTRETCALHTARLSCDTLVDFWSALGEETRQSLLRMKEEDFIERLMYRCAFNCLLVVDLLFGFIECILEKDENTFHAECMVIGTYVLSTMLK